VFPLFPADFLSFLPSIPKYGYEDFLTTLVVDACLSVMPANPKNFNVDNVRVVKIMGASLLDSRTIRGMVFGREPESNSSSHTMRFFSPMSADNLFIPSACAAVVSQAKDAKIAVYSCPLDTPKTETKGTVLISNGEELKSFAKQEEERLETVVRDIAATGVKVVVTGSGIGEMALHFLNRYNLLAIKVLSKFDLRRLCKATGATALARLVSLVSFSFCFTIFHIG